MYGKAKGCCWVSDDHLSIGHKRTVDLPRFDGCVRRLLARSGRTMVRWLCYNGRQGRGLLLVNKQSGALSPKMITHVDSILHRRKEAPKIHPIRGRLEPYLEGPARSGIANACETNTPEKNKLHLMPRCKPRTIAPRRALCQNQKTSSSSRLAWARCTTLMKTS